MKRMPFILGLLLLLAGCTGTSEPELPMLVAAADATSLHFLKARAANQGQLAEAGTWAKTGVLDLATLGGKLFVLTKDALARYDLAGFTEDTVPGEAAALDASWPLSGCDAGYLRRGRTDLLVVCGSDAVFRLPNAATAAGPPQGEPGTGTLAGFQPLAFALYPDNGAGKDRLAFAYTRPGGGWHLEIVGDDPTSPYFQKDLATPTPTTMAFHLATDSGTLGLVLSDGTQSALYAFDGQLKRVAGVPRRLSHLAGDLGLWAAFGEDGYLVVQGQAKAEATYPAFQAGWFHPNFYLYLASSTGITVLDVASPENPYPVHLPLPGVHALTGFTLQ